jgi:molybdate transport system substrate-binding protein
MTKPVRVLAASDLKFALARIASRYQMETGQMIEISYGSSGNMARQIQQGLPADIFMSADEALVVDLAQKGLTRPESPASTEPGVLYAQGRLALVLAPGSQIVLDTDLTGLRKAWPQAGKFAIANPEHAPYGRAAQQALQALGVWTQLQPNLVLGENVAQATQYVVTGAAQGGITALSLVQAPEFQGQVRYLALPASLHAPIRQRMVLLKATSPAGIAFFGYLQQPAVRATLAQYGFAAPNPAP